MSAGIPSLLDPSPGLLDFVVLRVMFLLDVSIPFEDTPLPVGHFLLYFYHLLSVFTIRLVVPALESRLFLLSHTHLFSFVDILYRSWLCLHNLLLVYEYSVHIPPIFLPVPFFEVFHF